MRIIPAIDIIDGKCVRLTKGDYSTKKIYSEDPLSVAKYFEDCGIRYLHLVDLDGAKTHKIVNYKTLESICKGTDLIVDFGGGIKSESDISIAINSGAHQITVGSIAAINPDVFITWVSKYGSDRIILGADCRNGKIATSGWIDTTDIDIIDFITNYERQGVKYVICTDIAKDGMLQGTSSDLYESIINQSNVKLIASGGVSTMDDIHKLKGIGCEGVIIGKAIYENKISLRQLSTFVLS